MLIRNKCVNHIFIYITYKYYILLNIVNMVIKSIPLFTIDKSGILINQKVL